MSGGSEPRSRFPHPIALLVACVFIAAAMSWVVPAGRYDRKDDPVTGRSVVVAGTYHRVEPAPVGIFQAFVAIPKGLGDAASVIFLVFVAGGAFTVVDQTGALRRGVDWLARRLDRREAVVIPVVCLAFAAGGALENMQEEIIAMVPVLLILCRRLGYDAVTACAISVGAAAVGSAFSPINPFQVGIAQNLAHVTLLSGGAFRSAALAVALAVWIGGTLRYARRTRTAATSPGFDAETPFGVRQAGVLVLVVATFGGFVYGVMALGWDFDQMSALFLAMGLAAGLLGGLGVSGTANSLAAGFSAMAYAGVLIGVARAVYVVMDQGRIIDTVVYGLFTPIAHLPVALAAVGMMVAQAAIHVPVPSVSGQAVLTMPVLAPLSDLLGLSRQVMILSYQFGAGLCELLTPTNGGLMAILAAAGVRYESWARFCGPLYLLLAGVGVVAILAGIAMGLQ